MIRPRPRQYFEIEKELKRNIDIRHMYNNILKMTTLSFDLFGQKIRFLSFYPYIQMYGLKTLN